MWAHQSVIDGSDVITYKCEDVSQCDNVQNTLAIIHISSLRPIRVQSGSNYYALTYLKKRNRKYVKNLSLVDELPIHMYYFLS